MNALRRARIAVGVMLFTSSLFSRMLVAWQSQPQSLQARGVARIDRYREYVRKTGDQQSLLGELGSAAAELEASFRGFTAASNNAQAAWSLVKLADCERYALISTLTSSAQTQTADQRSVTLARNSRSHYEQAASLARTAGSAAY